MHLVRFYLPVRDNTGAAFPAQMLADVSSELSGRFGGVTAHLLSPASGLWRDGGDIHADAEDANMYAAIDALADKLDRLVKKRKEKITDHHAEEGRRARQ